MSDQWGAPGEPPSAPPGAQPFPPQQPNVALAFRWSVERFKMHASAFVALAAVVAVASVLQDVGLKRVLEVAVDCVDPQSPGQQNACAVALADRLPLSAVLFFTGLVVSFFATIGVQRAALRATRGVRPTFADMFRAQYLGRYLLFTLAYAGLAAVGAFLCVLPGVAVLFLLQFGPYFVLDRGCGVGDAIRSTLHAVKENLGAVILVDLLYLAMGPVAEGIAGLAVGSFAAFLTLVTLPVTTLLFAHVYRQMNREYID